MDSKLTYESLESLLDCAKKGDGDACYNVAEYYYNQKDYTNAFKWYKLTTKCNNFNPLVYFNLGYAYQYGEGTEKDMFAAFDAYKKAAEYNLPQALHNLAFFYESGIVVSKDKNRADKLCRKATYELNKLQIDLNNKRKDCKELNQKCQNLEKKIEDMNKSIEKANQHEKKTFEELQLLQLKLAQLNKEYSKLRDKFDIGQKEFKKLTENLKKIIQSENILKREKENLEIKFIASEQFCHQLEAENRKQHQENQYRKNENFCLNQKLQEREVQVADLQEYLLDSEKRVESYRDAFNSMNEKIVLQKEDIAVLQSKNHELQQKKPFLRKKTILLWLDIIVVVLYFSYVTNFISFSFKEIITFTIITFLILLLSFLLLIKEKYVLHGAWCLIVDVVALCLNLVMWADGKKISVFFICVFCLIYIWLGCISFFKEVF